MNTIKDYIKWRCDLSFTADQLNIIDIALLTQLTYLEYRDVLNSKENTEGIKISTLIKKYKKVHHEKVLGLIFPSEMKHNILDFATSKRFRELYVREYIKIINDEENTQFCAITVKINDNLDVVVFCGTDDSIVGWKEDCLMLYQNPIPSQIKALEYLEKVTETSKNIIIAGHSKGGNLATYAATFASKKTKSKIKGVFSYDGPGFNTNIYETPEFLEISKKTFIYMPERSVIGRLFKHNEKCYIIKSSARGLLQHDVFSWNVKTKGFVEAKSFDKESDVIDKTLYELITKLSLENKVILVNSFFNMLYIDNSKNLIDLKTKKIKLFRAFIKLDKESKKIINEIGKALISNNIIRNGIVLDTIAFTKTEKKFKTNEKKKVRPTKK